MCGVDTNNFRPDCALVFWLSGFSKDATNPFLGPGGPGDTTGANKEPLFAFEATRLWPPSIAPDATPPTTPPQPHLGYAYPGGQVYLPETASGIVFPTPTDATIPAAQIPPYVYFDYQFYYLPDGTKSKPNFYTYGAGTSGVVMPYVHDVNNSGTNDATDTWANPKSYQIICAGQDNVFGALSSVTGATTKFRLYPTGIDYDPADNDNICSFNTGRSTLESAKP